MTRLSPWPKSSAVTAAGLPGAAGQVLESIDTVSNKGAWTNATPGGGLPAGGSPGQVVTNTGPGTGDWESPVENVVRVKDHGAKGDLFLGSNCTASGTGITLADANLTQADVGKKISINGAGTGGASYAGTIATVTGSHTGTLSVAVATNVAGAYYGYGTDDTAAFNAALAAGQALGVPRWTLLLDDVGYMIAGSYVTTNNYNAQIPLPYVTTVKSRVTIEIRSASSASRPKPYSNPVVKGDGPIIFSSQANSGGGTAFPGTAVGVPSVIGGPATRGPGSTFTQACPVVRGVVFLGPHWPHPTFLDFGLCQQAWVDDNLFATNEDESLITPGWNTNVGVIMPGVNNNDTAQMNRNSAMGTTVGYVAGEHTTGTGNLTYETVIALGVPAYETMNHPAHLGAFESIHSIYHVSGWDPNISSNHGASDQVACSMTIDLWDAEDATSATTYATSYHVHCNGNFFFSAQAAKVKAGVGPVANGWITESNNTRIVDLNQPRGPQTVALPGSGNAFPVIYRDTIYCLQNIASFSSIAIAGVATGLADGENCISVPVPSGMGLTVSYSAGAAVTALIVA